MVANLIEILTMDKIIQIVLNALNAITLLLKATCDLLKEGLVQKLLFYIFRETLGFSEGYSRYLVAGIILVILGFTVILEMREGILLKI